MSHVDNSIEIVVNGAKETVPASSTIAELIEKFEEADKHLVVELNGRCVYPKNYAETRVAPGDAVEFIHAAFGG